MQVLLYITVEPLNISNKSDHLFLVTKQIDSISSIFHVPLSYFYMTSCEWEPPISDCFGWTKLVIPYRRFDHFLLLNVNHLQSRKTLQNTIDIFSCNRKYYIHVSWEESLYLLSRWQEYSSTNIIIQDYVQIIVVILSLNSRTCLLSPEMFPKADPHKQLFQLMLTMQGRRDFPFRTS